MFGKKPKDPKRHSNLVTSLFTSFLNLNFASPLFVKCHEKIPEYLADNIAKSTADQYYLSFMRYSKFCTSNGFAALPIDKEVVLAYFIFLAEEKSSLASVLTSRSAIRHYGIINQPHLPCPTDSLDISLVVRSIQRKLGKPVKKANPTTKPIIVKLIDTLEGDQLLTSDFKKNIDIWQVVTKTVFKFYSFARFEEILILRKSDFLFFDNGDVEVTISKAKNNQFHEARTSYICKSDDKYCPVNLFKKYFLRIDSDLDHLFVPRISYDLVYLNEQTNYAYCLSKFRKALFNIGIQDFMDYGEHSDKGGGISSAANAGVDTYALQVHGRLKSDCIPKLYHKKSISFKQRVSTVLNNL